MKTDEKILKALNKKPKTLFFWKGYLLDWVVDLAIAGIIVYIITTFAFQNLYVVGSSMNPTLNNGETILINKLTYLVKKPSRDDLVAFRHVDSSENELNVVKRIIGLPGDKIELTNDMLYVNNQEVKFFIEEHNSSGLAKKGNMDYPIYVPPNSYFVLGDNIANSMDSRYEEIGLIPDEELTGKIFMRIWPFWKIKLL